MLKAWKNQRNETKIEIRRKMSFEVYGDVKNRGGIRTFCCMIY